MFKVKTWLVIIVAIMVIPGISLAAAFSRTNRMLDIPTATFLPTDTLTLFANMDPANPESTFSSRISGAGLNLNAAYGISDSIQVGASIFGMNSLALRVKTTFTMMGDYPVVMGLENIGFKKTLYPSGIQQYGSYEYRTLP